MSPKERFLAALEIRPSDRVPVMFQHLGGAYHLMDVTGTSISEGLSTVSGHKRLCLGALREFGFDNVMVGWGDILAEGEALGMEVVFGNPRTYPQGNELPSEVIDRLEPADPWKGAIWSVQLNAARELVAEVGDEALVIASMNDPFLVASAVRGFEQLLMDQIAEPKAAHRLLGVVLRTLKEGARILKEECGVEVVFLGDGIADASQNDLANSQVFDIPYAAELVGHMRELGLKVILSNCAMSGYVEEQMRACGPDAMHIASEGRAYPGMLTAMRNERCLAAGISPMRKILPMAPDEIEMEARKLLSEFGPSPGFVLASAGEMPLETPAENIVALSRATR